MNIPFVGYARDNTGLGIADALVEAFPITDLNLNTKGVNALAQTYPDATTGRWNLFVESTESPTGYVSIKISRGDTVRWIEGDATIQAQNFFAEHGRAPILDNSITDAHIGSRTISQTTAPSGNTGTLTSLIGGLANRIKTITGETSWWQAPKLSIDTIYNRFLGTSSGHDHSGVTGEGPKLDPAEALIWLPARASDVGNFETEAASNNTNWSISSSSANLSIDLIAVTVAPGTWYVSFGANLTADDNTMTCYLYRGTSMLADAYVGFGLGASGLMHSPASKTVRVYVGGTQPVELAVRARANQGGGQCDSPWIAAIRVD